MRTTSTTTKKTPAMPKQPAAIDAVALLTEDHEHVKAMFEEYEGLGERAFASKKKLSTKICTELTKHATAEEEIFYPAVQAAGKEEGEMVDEATVEHASAKDLIAQIMAMEASEDLFDARAVMLGARFDGRQEVLTGVNPQDQIAVSHAFAIKSAMLMSRLGAGCADD